MYGFIIFLTFQNRKRIGAKNVNDDNLITFKCSKENDRKYEILSLDRIVVSLSWISKSTVHLHFCIWASLHDWSNISLHLNNIRRILFSGS